MTDQKPTSVTVAWFTQAAAADKEFAEQCEREAATLVTAHIGRSNPYRVPDEVIGRATLEVAADLFYRKSTRNGIAGFEGMDSQPFRITRNPMAAAYPILNAFIPQGLA